LGKEVLDWDHEKYINKAPQAYEAKTIFEVLDIQPSVNPIQIGFGFGWQTIIAAILEEVMHFAALPAGL